MPCVLQVLVQESIMIILINPLTLVPAVTSVGLLTSSALAKIDIIYAQILKEEKIRQSNQLNGA